jgi:hypothetical protein
MVLYIYGGRLVTHPNLSSPCGPKVCGFSQHGFDIALTYTRWHPCTLGDYFLLLARPCWSSSRTPSSLLRLFPQHAGPHFRTMRYVATGLASVAIYRGDHAHTAPSNSKKRCHGSSARSRLTCRSVVSRGIGICLPPLPPSSQPSPTPSYVHTSFLGRDRLPFAELLGVGSG